MIVLRALMADSFPQRPLPFPNQFIPIPMASRRSGELSNPPPALVVLMSDNVPGFAPLLKAESH